MESPAEILDQTGDLSNKTSITDATDTHHLSKRITKDTWDAIEKKFSAYDTLVVLALRNYVMSNHAQHVGQTKTDIIASKKKIIGDTYYISVVQPWLVEHGYVKSDATATKKVTQKLKKSDIIRQQNTTKLVTEQFQVVKMAMESQNEHSLNLAFKSDIIEFVGVAFIMKMANIIANKESNSTREKYVDTMSLLVSVQHFIEQCKYVKGANIASPQQQADVSNAMLVDLVKKYEETEKVFPFDGLKICDIAPQLLYWSPFDKFLPIQNVTIRPHQKQIIDTIVSNMSTGFICSYRATIGSGKTTVVEAIACYLSYLRETSYEYKNIQLLFACNMKSVRDQVASIFYNTNKPFGIARLDTTECGYKIVNNYNCRDSKRLAIIASPEVAWLILNDKQNTDKKVNTQYMLFHDEPTTGADECDNTLYHNVRLMLSLPKWSILSSATLPPIDKLDITDIAQKANPSVKLIEITSNDIQIGCNVMTFDGKLFVPFSICKTASELKNTISMIKFTPFLGRCLTGKVATRLWLLMKTEGIPALPNIKELFKDVANMTATKVCQLCISLLELLADQKDNVIQKICSSVCSEQDEPLRTVTFSDIGTKDAWKYPGMTLIATTDPTGFALANFAALLEELKTRGKVATAAQLLDQYKKDTERFKNQLDSIISSMQSEKDDRQRGGGDGKQKKRGASEEEKSRKRAELEADAPPIGFPEWAQIGTQQHLTYFCSQHSPQHSSQQFQAQRTAFAIELIYNDLLSLMVPDEFIRLLMCGVGIYEPSSKLLGEDYFDIVLRMASDGMLQYVIADNSISYGTNYPFARVIITPEFAQMYSFNSCVQGMGRGGRWGKSWKAECFIPCLVIEKIHKCIALSSYYDPTEAHNINKMTKQTNGQATTTINDTIKALEQQIKDEINAKHMCISFVDNSSAVQKAEQKADQKAEQKADQKAEQKAEQKTEQKAEQKAEQKTEQKAEQKAEQKLEQKAEQKAEQKEKGKYMPPSKRQTELPESPKQFEQPKPNMFARKAFDHPTGELTRDTFAQKMPDKPHAELSREMFARKAPEQPKTDVFARKAIKQETHMPEKPDAPTEWRSKKK